VEEAALAAAFQSAAPEQNVGKNLERGE